jgi:2-keto-4-pentenoate hydratase/2-oxohepta-3-ene-1,7-dioic acid hydratase in catechol pathway
MRLVRYNGGRIGVWQDGVVYDATTAVGLDPTAWPPVGMVQLIKNFDALRPKLESVVKSPGAAVAKTRLEVPILWPNKLLAFPTNYLAHALEFNSPNRADLNGFFLKANSSLSGPQDPIVLPDLPGREIHHECELAIVIGRTARHVCTAQALGCVFGYACLIDVTVRGKEERVMRKSYDTFCPIGPALVTADEVGEPSALDLKLWVNDDLRQHANTRDFIVDVPNMISLASSVATIYPGDIIATGTPAGVGPIKAGDHITIEIERVGHMSVPVEQGRGGDNVAMRKRAP